MVVPYSEAQPMARISPPLKLQADQREDLETILRKKTIEARLAQRARLILLASEGYGNVEIGEILGMDRNHVSKWRQRFEDGGIDALCDKARCGRPPKYTSIHKQKVVTKVWLSRLATHLVFSAIESNSQQFWSMVCSN